MAEVYIGVGSNINPEAHIRSAVSMIDAELGVCKISRVYESEPVGLDGNRFLNLVLSVCTDIKPRTLLTILREIESKNGRSRPDTKYSNKTLDLDILLYGAVSGKFDSVVFPRQDIYQYAHVLRPLCDIAADKVDTESMVSYSNLWDRLKGDLPKIEPVPIRLEYCG